MTAFAAAAMLAGDQRVADDDPTADACAERQQYDAVKLLAGTAPEFAVGGGVGVVGERDREFEVVAEAVANREVPPTGKIARAEDQAVGDVHGSGRGDAGAGDVATLEAGVAQHLLDSLRH